MLLFKLETYILFNKPILFAKLYYSYVDYLDVFRSSHASVPTISLFS